MSVPDPTPVRTFRRIGLWAPFVLVGVAFVAWSGAWLWARAEAGRRLDAAAIELSRSGYQIGWKDRTISGYPFRIDVTLTQARVREPSGWALEAPVLEAEGYLHAPGHWVLAAPRGLTFVRPIGGPVAVTGETLRASLRDIDKRPPSFSFQGIELAFAPAAGARPYFLSAADKVEFHLRAGPDDEGGVFLKIDGGKASLGGLFAAVAQDRPIAVEWNSTLTRMSAFKGPDWPGAARAWSEAGGLIKVRRAGVTAGGAALDANDGVLSVGSDGRLRGTLDVRLRQAPRAFAAMGQAGTVSPEVADAAAAAAAAQAQTQQTGGAARASLTFEAGRATVGPVVLGAAPKIYEPR